MTRIDSQMPYPSLARTAEKPSAKQHDGNDFLHHLGADKAAVGEQENRADAGDGRRFGRADTDPGASDVSLQTTRPGLDHPGASAPVDDIAAAMMEVPGTGNLPLQAAQRAPTTVDGVATRARVFEQHWFANGYLSFITDVGDESAPRKDGGAAATPVERMPAAMTSGAAPSTLIPAGNALAEGAAPWPVVVEGPASVVGTAERSIERLARVLGPLVMADQPWPERLLRVSPRPGGKVTLWVRDYTLSPQAMGPLVAHLRQLARKNGIGLERVVINGTVVWHYETFKGEN